MKRADQATTVVIMLITVVYLVVANTYPPGARVVPSIVGGATLALAAIQLVGARVRVLRPLLGTFEPGEEAQVFANPAMRRRLYIVSASLLVLPVLIVLVGIVVALPLYVFVFVGVISRRRSIIVLGTTAALTAAVYGLLVLLLGMRITEGFLWELL